MHKHILMLIDHLLNPDKYTQEQLDQNYADTDAAVYTTNTAYAYATTAAANAYVYATTAAADAAAVDYWLRRYFKETGENKQDYIDAINKDNKQ